MLSVIAAAALFILTGMYGPVDSFLLLNSDGGPLVDMMFRFITYFGDVLLWIPMIGYVIWKKRKLYLPMVTASFTLVILLVQICKMFILPDEPRPMGYIDDGSFIHTVTGVEVKLVGSFPSSHTATAFTFFLMICLMYKKRWWLVAGFCMAMMVGYSRIYLAQHFPLDVAAGIIAATLSVAASIPFQSWVGKRNIRVGDHVKM